MPNRLTAAAVRTVQFVQKCIPGYRRAIREVLKDGHNALEVVIIPGRLTADFANPCWSKRESWMDRTGGARGQFLAIIADPDDTHCERLYRSVAARVPVPVEDVEDAAVCHSDVVQTKRLLLIGRRVIALWSTRRDPVAAFHKRAASRRYHAASELERTHPAFEDRRMAREALQQARRAVMTAEHDYMTVCAA